ncbi:unnamed protein product [Mycetohabitans rhizoxinica HKI 454]|uniref:Uncharacterized protein n=1 Tax=Mycetohabitans rhizoxinica (strain DSM 19002 / CIP 109453 / HKI 454) TaxID=882378 RepID=E5ALY3_MYCRK|nr:unnamed protein product [Mycetohabitans rhizoxinica HKI 454]
MSIRLNEALASPEFVAAQLAPGTRPAPTRKSSCTHLVAM